MFCNNTGNRNGKSTSCNNRSGTITDLQRSISHAHSQRSEHLQLDTIHEPELNHRFECDS
jgi:hypothetical protein